MPTKFSFTSLSYIAGIFTAVVGCVVLVGWQFDISGLKSVLPSAVSMKANTAALFVLAGISLVLIQRPTRFASNLVRFLSLIILLVGILSLCQNIFGWDTGLDEFLFHEPNGTVGTSHPGLMAPYTSLNFIMVGLALGLFTSKGLKSRFLHDFAIIFTLVISIIGLLGYLSGFMELAGPIVFTKMAVHTAFSFFVLCLGMLLTVYKRQGSPVTIEQKLFAGLTITAVVIIYISLLSISGIQLLNLAGKRVENTQQVKKELFRCLSLVVDVEAGSRGFLLSGDENYTEPQKKASVELPGLLQNLGSKLSSDPRQKKTFILLEQLISERIEIAEQLCQTRRSQGFEKALLLFSTGKGETITDSIRVIADQMTDVETQLNQLKNDEGKTNSIRTQIIIYFSISIQLLLLLIIFVVFKLDLNNRKQSEQDIKLKNQELQKINAEKDKFFSIIAHDLRGSFNGFLGLTQIMAEELPSLTMAEVQKIAVSLKKSAMKLFNLLENLLEWSQIQKGTLPFNPAAIQLSQTVNEDIAIFSESAKTKEIEIALNIPEGIEIFADLNMFQTIIRNMVSNALKFTHNGGKVSVSAKESGYKVIEISIQDSGIGISEEMIQDLFRIDVETRRKGTEGEPSTGLGLFLCKEFVEKNGGKLRVESKEGKGSTFSFTIPGNARF